jgi:hypothetical protein
MAIDKKRTFSPNEKNAKWFVPQRNESGKKDATV